MNNIEQVKNELGFMLRQAQGGMIPRRVPMTPRLMELTDESTAQKIYDEIIKQLEEDSGTTIERKES